LTIALWGIPGIAAGVTLAALWGVQRAAPERLWTAAAATAGWWALTGALAASGVLARFDVLPPPMALMMGAVLTLGVVLARSDLGGALARGTPLWALVGLQAFRLPLELVMHQAAVDGVMPPELSYSGYNFDILTGASALVLAPLLASGKVGRGWVWAWSALGIAALAMIVFIAVASSPMVRLFGDDPAHINTWVLQVPYVWLPTVLVVAAIAGHGVVLRALRG
jgi:hypothetical protein